jgi:DNA-binding NarL/FixJ family response regulator
LTRLFFLKIYRIPCLLGAKMANIAIVITGGVRALSALDLRDRFLSDGHQVRIFASKNALRFLWAHLLRRPIAIPSFFRHFRPQFSETLAYFAYQTVGVPHVAEGKWADIAVMVPATCNSLGKLVAGLSDNYPLLVTRALPRTKKVIVVPSMNPEMWFDPLLQRNVDLLNATEKYQVVCPSRGQMACGDVGFGAQASLADIVAETYRALGLDGKVETLFQGPCYRTPWDVDNKEPPSAESANVVLVDEDRALRTEIINVLQRAYPRCVVHQFDSPGEAIPWLKENRASVVLTELETAEGATGFDLIELCRRSGSNECSIMVTSTKDRRSVGAEKLARREVQFLLKPLNVTFAVGMIVGSLSGMRYQPSIKVRKLAEGEVLFREGDPGTNVYLVESGTLKITKTRDGAEITIRHVHGGEMVGEIAFFDRSKRSATVIAVEPSNLVDIDADQFRDYLDRQPTWLTAMIQTLLERLRDTTERLAAVGSDAKSD